MKSRIKFFVRLRSEPSSDLKERALFFKPFYRSITKRKSDIYIWARDALILPSFLDKRVAVYNGKSFVSTVVRSSMIGRRFGEFSVPKRSAAYDKSPKRLPGKKRGGK